MKIHHASTYRRKFKPNYVISRSADDSKLILKSVIKLYGIRSYARSLDIRYPNVYAYIDNMFDKLNGHKFAEKCYWLMHDITDFPKCKMCGKHHTSFINFIAGYRECCSMQCGNKYKLVKVISIRQFETSYENDQRFRNDIIKAEINLHNHIYLSHLIAKAPNALNYVAFRYDHLQGHDISEKLYWFINGLTEFPKCIVCGKDIYAFRNIAIGYSSHCPEHTMLDENVRRQIGNTRKLHAIEDANFNSMVQAKRRATNVKNGHSPTWNNSEKAKQTFHREWIQTGKIKDIIDRAELTRIQKYGSRSYNNREQIHETCLIEYGVSSYSQTDEFIQKVKETNQKNRGVDFPGQSPECQEKRISTCMDLYGVPNYAQSDAFKQLWDDKEFVAKVQAKSYVTKRRNNSFNISKPEHQVKMMLMEAFGDNNIICQYHDERYPFRCDFYIKPTDTFVECNFHWTHMGHFYNENSADDIEILNKLRGKANAKRQSKPNKANMYEKAIEVWIKRDIMKVNMAKANNLNYIVFWNIDEFNVWLTGNMQE